MTKCKEKNCSNEATKEKKYCKYHRSRIEDAVKGTIALGTTLLTITIFRKLK